VTPSRPFFVFWRPFRNSAVVDQQSRNGATDKEAAKASTSNFKRLVGLAKPEKWKMTGKITIVHLILEIDIHTHV